MRAAGAEDAESEHGAANKYHLAHHVCIEAAVNQSVHQPSAHHEIHERRDQPGHACVKKRMQQIDVECN